MKNTLENINFYKDPNKIKRKHQRRTKQNNFYYPVFQNVKNFLAELHLLLTPHVAKKAVFNKLPIIGFKNDRSLKDHLVWEIHLHYSS